MKKLKPLMSSESIEWATPDDFFTEMNTQYGAFTIDVCATPENTKCPVYYTKSTNGLTQPWSGVCWMNPPYGREIKSWMKKAYNESLRGVRVVCLVPARTDTVWWHDYAIKGQITFIKGRLKFKGAKHNAPFPSAVVVFN